ncbi:MlaC/ttg2D family ABC transporter substrate-binding protein [Pseudogemmobacter sp. W21_MBD1_M6]|jgi:phospholipid transport system substrate-binding protein|uniref:MlaC/ttg2D family ABC transporter substrate-binding protein n=1 Tax=Pseudogemmobacter sp. W21_MBD1_M6 TaxID=3240271 RepID=UPI003F947A33
MRNNLTRRAVLGSAAAAVAVVASPFPAFALNTAEARALISSVVDEINRVISSGQSESQMIADFERLFVKYSDVPTIARYALGADARSASAAQMRAFTQAFQGYISRKYGKRFREFIGGRIEVNEAKKVKSFYEVRTTAYLKGEAPFDVTFLVSDQSGRNLFFNLFIEGINMLLTERTEIGAMLDRRNGDFDAMVADLKRAG